VKSLKRGKSTSRPEIVNISEHGFWILVKRREYFLPFEQFPWFRQASVDQISNVELLHGSHLYWPRLDVDLSLNIIEHPQKYKLVAS
jgi:hypothetical protein